MADLPEDIPPIKICTYLVSFNGTFPRRNCLVENLVHKPKWEEQVATNTYIFFWVDLSSSHNGALFSWKYLINIPTKCKTSD